MNLPLILWLLSNQLSFEERCTLTWFHPIGDYILRSVHDLHIGFECSVEGLNLTYRQIQHWISGGVVIVDPHDSTLAVHTAHKEGGTSWWLAKTQWANTTWNDSTLFDLNSNVFHTSWYKLFNIILLSSLTVTQSFHWSFVWLVYFRCDFNFELQMAVSFNFLKSHLCQTYYPIYV